MAYTVEQKIKGRIYLYKVESYWDKEKKQSRQKRTYIGPKQNKNKLRIKSKSSDLISKNFGSIFLLQFLSDKLKLTEILKSVFPENYLEIFALAYYELMEASAFYLFPYWLDEQYLPGVKKLYSSGISELCECLGRSEKQRIDFILRWAEYLKPIEGIYYDITSISSYSTNIDFVEWGYNRDKENLPQLNMGVTFCQNNLLPIFYTLYPGSIVDVTTLKNCIKYLDIFDLKDILFVLDRGFFSKANILEMHNSENKIAFIQPLPFSLKKVKALARQNKRQLPNPLNAFKYNGEILYYRPASIDFDETNFDVHIFFNEKAEIEQKHNFLSSLFEIEEKFTGKRFNSLKEYLKFKKSDVPEKYGEYFKWNKSSLQIERNVKKINAYISNMGSFLILTNQQGMDKVDVLTYYRKRDFVEKIFDVVKNEIDGDRLRAHSNYSMHGRLFIKFISLIIHTEISKAMKKKKLFEKYSVKELLAELKKIKVIKIDELVKSKR
ncbi:MAG: IS1634 family transposase [Candidatus Hodarchaeales archaeon]|jgi:transposase